MYSREIVNFFSSVKCLGLSKTFNIGIFSDSINVVNVKLCMMVQLIELYLFIPLSVTLTIYFMVTDVSEILTAIVLFKFLSTVLYMLYGCFMH